MSFVRSCCGPEKVGSQKKVLRFSPAAKKGVWIVDPLDGTREFVARIPEFCISVAMVDNGNQSPTAFAILPPMKFFSVALRRDLRTTDVQLRLAGDLASLNGAVVLASRSEVKQGEWKTFQNRNFEARVAAGLS